ncbi:bifunctional (p)ppGpp synthetase/guanosine-3',5'-bis(diphosphate) 3'-pyrophosphohydrolase [Paludicola sp. MB14-C6]|uniref:RelA/SpoT family protein n=1 Tax=Paludihabitans sp. MB14-C6 TaxID=3070656 RepID=UPI0027DC8418|nr:bifunctional (p)ppGpp synthetase/guanosine-3',5'-bis(diphosphate) 3'-pyrophosphohydrolase [Paludicola sp. MB14-C6]WMJ22388.1 bifunctional (p)ppGpp synthetase/guanosine-3',5'-bis(diphosphate) 3'-pyrophosphohydrolase [Paludicola sp. MB14-C6]
MKHRTFEELEQYIIDSERQISLERVKKAYDIASVAHADQLRASGEPYVIHPIEVAFILVDLGMDTDSVCAGLLHDVVEDTDISLEEIGRLFGNEVASLVDGVTKIGKIPLTTKEEQQAENVRKMLLAMAEDVRVIIIKLADRLHNMRTLMYRPDHKQRETALETMEVYAPIAHRLGIRAMKEELEDLALHYLDPVACKEIENILAKNSAERTSFVSSIEEKILSRLGEYDIEPHIEGRVKSLYGIYRKVYMAGRGFDEVYDIYAVRIIVSTVIECYNILGIIHDMFRPIPNRFKDYISTPKPNMYQSLHTTVIGREGIPFEIQIRTWDMHYTAEYGVAAHWKYKAGIKGKDKLEEGLAWVRQIIEAQQESEGAEDIVKTIKTDLASEEVFVFTPKGDVKSLPIGSTIIDFAYAIHSAVGNRMVGAKIDSRMVSLDTTLKTGQIIDIITTKAEGHGPNREWLKIAKTSEARSKIRAWFKKERREENVIEGKAELEREFKRNYINLPEKELQEFILNIAKRQHYDTVEDLYAAIGYGGVILSRIMQRIKEDYQKIIKPVDTEGLAAQLAVPSSKNLSGVLIEGIDNCLVKFAQCCNPLPGDDIIGFITRGHGVSVHKKDCINVISSMAQEDQRPRWIGAKFASTVVQKGFRSTLDILATDRNGLIADVSILFANMRVQLHELNARELKNSNCNIVATIGIQDIVQLKNIIQKLEKIDGIISVERSGK